MNWFLTSDLHLGHVRALEIMPNRPWTTVDDMSHGLIDNYNDTVGPDDTCIFLGDIIMGKKFENVPRYLPMLNGTKILVVGNHDFLPSEMKPDKLKRMEDLYLSNGIHSIYYGCVGLNEFTCRASDSKIKVCHFPTVSIPDHADQYEQRYLDLHPTIQDDEYLLHGHSHSRQHLTGPRILHVGVDAEAWNYRPVSLLTVFTTLGIPIN
jgi:calcineurin-like phosphoesterase family protein